MNNLEIINESVRKILQDKFGIEVKFTTEFPELKNGDVTCNVALVAGKILQKNPVELAKEISGYLQNDLTDIVQKIEVAGPGFLNFWLKNKAIRAALCEDLKIQSVFSNKKILVEHTSINLFKPFTIGHLMNNFTGEYITRAMKVLGGEVIDISYPSDISIGIAKAIYIIKLDGGLDFLKSKNSIDEAVKYLGETYVRGVAKYKKFEEERDEAKISEIKMIANNLYGNVSGEDLEIYQYSKKINLDYFFEMNKKLGSDFSGFIFESEAGERGKEIVLENTRENKVFQKSEGAVVYIPDESRKDINTTVFINSEGNPTYAGKDIGLLDLKFSRFSPDFSFFVTDNEQSTHFKVVLDAAEKIDKEWVSKSHHVSHGRMTFKGKKMSSRLGGVPSADEVIQAVFEDVVERSDEKIKDLSEGEKEKLQFEIALSALRVAILRSKPGVNIDFDPERAASFEGDSGPYLCYTHARASSLLRKGEENNILPTPDIREREVTGVERKILQFKNILKSSSEEIAPQKLVKYLFDLASEFNGFYANNKIVDIENISTSQNNLYITLKVVEVLKKGLYVLGIQAPEKM